MHRKKLKQISMVAARAAEARLRWMILEAEVYLMRHGASERACRANAIFVAAEAISLGASNAEPFKWLEQEHPRVHQRFTRLATRAPRSRTARFAFRE